MSVCRVFQEETVDEADVNLLPTREWTRKQIRSFISLRNRLNRLRKSKATELRVTRDYPDCETDEEAWHAFCKQTKPLLSVMLGIHQRTLEKLMEHEASWLSSDLEWFREHSQWIFPWIYCSLACLRLPLEPNVHNSLREIAKTCISLRNQFTSSDTANVLPLNLIICIVSQTFNQLDLSGRTR